MKKITLVLIFILFHTFCFSQIAPTLGVGLETLTMNKGTIDVKVLTEIITAKQKELKQEALRRFMYKLFPEANYTTKFYIQNCLNILLNEKNPKVIEKEVLKLTTNYALALGVTYALINSKEPSIQSLFEEINTSYKANMRFSTHYLKGEIVNDKKEKIDALTTEILTIKEGINENNKNDKIDEIEKKTKRLTRIKIRSDYEDNNQIAEVPFGIILDVVSLSLSSIEELQTKGFYINKIDYRTDSFYLNLNSLKETEFKKSLNSLNDSIFKTVEPYIIHYDVIKEFLKHKKTDSGDIKSMLKNALFSETNAFISENKSDEWFKTFYTSKSPTEKEIKINKAVDNILIYTKRIAVKTEIDNVFSRINSEIINDNKTLDFSDLNNAIKIYNDNHVIKLVPIKSIVLNRIDTMNIKEGNEALEKVISLINHEIKNRTSKANLDAIFNSTKLDSESTKSLKSAVKNQIELLTSLESKLNTMNESVGGTLEKLKTDLAGNYKELSASDKFSSAIIENKTNGILTEILNIDALSLQSSDSITARKASTFFSELYIKVKAISNNEATLENLNELESYVINQTIELKIFDEKNKLTYNKFLNKIQHFVLLQKFNIVNKANDLKKYSKELANVFDFISNLDKLDKATTYQSLVDMLKNGSTSVEENLPNDKFKDEYILFINAIKKYTIINPTAEKEYISIDVVSFLNDLQQFYNRDNGSIFSLYLTLGLNENFFFDNFTFPDSTEEPIKNIGFASEKIGLKIKIASFKKSRGYENAIIDDVYLNKKAPFLNEFYGILYGSGLLYSLANTSTNENFDFPHVGLGIGVRFYNALDLNLILGFPFVKDSNFGENMFWGIGLDIPLGEYLEKLGNKN
jgi:hypothetical protein